MATVEQIYPTLDERGILAQEHPCWMTTFRPEARFEQLDDDYQAWKRVTGILLTIVSIGALLAAVSVVLCMSN